MQTVKSLIHLEKDQLRDLDVALDREWLVTNGLGGFASGTVSLAHTRRYHGWLFAALRPPLERTLMVSKMEVTARYKGSRYALACNEFSGGAIHPEGYRRLQSFALENSLPVWTYALGDALLEMRIWMRHRHNTTYVMFSLVRASDAMDLEVVPLCTYRDYHSHSHGGWTLDNGPVGGGFEISAFAGACPYRIVSDKGNFHPKSNWYWNFRHRVEGRRGLDETEDLYAPGLFALSLHPEDRATITCSTERVEPQDGQTDLQLERARLDTLVEKVPPGQPAWIRQLTLAADQFIVERHVRVDGGTKKAGKTVIAGYPWFGDWGRDTMIALPGLTLCTGREDVAADILRTFARYHSDGMLPNRFPDAGEEPEYNNVDAALWYVQAVSAYLSTTPDDALLKELFPVLEDIVAWYEKGTRYGIHVDAKDGLLYAGEPGVQLTWMDAKVGNWVVTPRTGKPVEINALWHNALKQLSGWAAHLGKKKAAAVYGRRADDVAKSFRERFWHAEGGYLYDVVDTTHDPGADATLRPNQIIAVSLPHGLLAPEQEKKIVDICAERLWTPRGLRTLDTGALAYAGVYEGDQRRRDASYHQGTVWPWLLGPFASAHFKVYGDAKKARSFLAGMKDHLSEGCLGTLGEIFDGDPPHAPRGCFAQAWSVAEVLRAWMQIAEPRRAADAGTAPAKTPPRKRKTPPRKRKT